MPRPMLCSLLLLACFSSYAAAQPYVVDPAHTSVVFSVGHMGYSFTYGMFRETAGSVVLDEGDPTKSRFDLMVKVASISTGNEARDKHLLNADFFDVEKFPAITFKGTPMGAAQDQKGRTVYQVKGQLTMHGVSKEVTLPMTLLKLENDYQGKPRVGFHCETVVNRVDYGVGEDNPAISRNIGVTFSFEAAQP